MLTDNMFVVEVTGITGAAYPPSLLRTIAEKLHAHWFVLFQGRPRPLWARYYVDNTLLIKQRPRLRERANVLILKGGSKLTEVELNELVAISHDSDRLILDDIRSFKYPVDVVLRRGGVLQSCVHIEDARWQRMRSERKLEPKLSLLLTAQLPVIQEAYDRDEEFLKLRTEHPEYYCPTPARVAEQQQEWVAAVQRLPGVRIVERKAYDPDAFAAELCQLIVSSGEMVDLQTLRRASCFMSYSAKDQRFSDRLDSDLKSNGIATSYFPEQPYEAGQPIWEQIERSIAANASVVIIASKNSLLSQAVLRELQLTIEIGSRRSRGALKVAAIDDYVFVDWRNEHAQYVRDRIIADFRGWATDDEAYNRGLRKILAGLRAA
jgi:hypothetical protein